MGELVREDRGEEEERGDRRDDERLLSRPRGEVRGIDRVRKRQHHEKEDQDPRDVYPNVDPEEPRDTDRTGHCSEHTGRPVELPTVPELASMIDHAVLKPTQTERDVVSACNLALREHIASVCVKP